MRHKHTLAHTHTHILCTHKKYTFSTRPVPACVPDKSNRIDWQKSKIFDLNEFSGLIHFKCSTKLFESFDEFERKLLQNIQETAFVKLS